MDQHKYRTAGVQEKLEIVGVEDEAGNPISALTILSLLERVAGIIDNVQSSQQRMEERQLELENNIKTIQGDVLKLAKDHNDTSGTVEKLLQKTRKVSANVKEVRTRVEKQNVRVKKVETTQDELLTRNKFRVVIYQVSSSLGGVRSKVLDGCNQIVVADPLDWFNEWKQSLCHSRAAEVESFKGFLSAHFYIGSE